ncbi:MAG TPA: 16S rRNA (guanine(966)-N(2))-methyltransferase RsmD [Nitrospira sp.]|nr:16S rRNA (guanine(966)-N(2))-methyltransferase RsmD [Nitrospira sp.]
MRVIAGLHRGRRLCGPQETGVRPTSDKVREALFSILGPKVPGSRFLDLYAGTGAVGIEALSRGAAFVTFVESDPKMVEVIRQNLATCRLSDQAEVRPARIEMLCEHRDRWNGRYDIAFADPPYDERRIEFLQGLWMLGALTPEGILVIEQRTKAAVPASFEGAGLIKRYVYGDTALSLYRSANGAVRSA